MNGVIQEMTRIQHDGYGRPHIDGIAGCSVSHADGFTALAVSRHPIGVDIEVLRPVNAWDLWPYCTERERGMMRAVDSMQERAHVALTMWTRKEAVLKLLGCGLRVPPECVDVSGPHVDITAALHAMRHDEDLTQLAEEICHRSVEVCSWECPVSTDVREVADGPKSVGTTVLLSIARYAAYPQEKADSMPVRLVSDVSEPSMICGAWSTA
ncbi:4'-phosphopantetheinyl transferase family protein [Bifidobacterium samirii]|uniref:4'-phosphopantetheinyl transferase n=1 Tax=Bifidobacterium samirii TaxID=2306974 RepID=A0A430FV53_9BIFI|nr:4'-phosphopantetheinyl transferase superfamily protein [Bifidobacterium samirii]RSX57276.1 4'-phosphopantetheinyl transferase [Bifidobacterium samirii]